MAAIRYDDNFNLPHVCLSGTRHIYLHIIIHLRLLASRSTGVGAASFIHSFGCDLADSSTLLYRIPDEVENKLHRFWRLSTHSAMGITDFRRTEPSRCICSCTYGRKEKTLARIWLAYTFLFEPYRI